MVAKAYHINNNLYHYAGNNPVKYTDPTGEVLETAWDIGCTLFDLGTAIYKTSKGDLSGWIDVGADLASVVIPGLPAGLSKVDNVIDIVDDIKDSKNILKKVKIDSSKYPETASHIRDAQAKGYPSKLTVDRAGAKANRAESLKGYDKIPGKQPDEYPPAMFKEGGKGADIRAISPSDNMGAGASMGNQLRNIKDGTIVEIVVE